VRELENVAERLVLGLEDPCSLDVEDRSDNSEGDSLGDKINAFERCLIARELERNKGNIAATYKALHLPRKTLYYKMKKHALLKE